MGAVAAAAAAAKAAADVVVEADGAEVTDSTGAAEEFSVVAVVADKLRKGSVELDRARRIRVAGTCTCECGSRPIPTAPGCIPSGCVVAVVVVVVVVVVVDIVAVVVVVVLVVVDIVAVVVVVVVLVVVVVAAAVVVEEEEEEEEEEEDNDAEDEDDNDDNIDGRNDAAAAVAAAEEDVALAYVINEANDAEAGEAEAERGSAADAPLEGAMGVSALEFIVRLKAACRLACACANTCRAMCCCWSSAVEEYICDTVVREDIEMGASSPSSSCVGGGPNSRRDLRRS